MENRQPQKMIAKFRLVLLAIYVIVTVWEVGLFLQADKETTWNELHTAAYSLLLFLGMVFGLIVVQRLGLRSIVGKAFFFGALGLTFWGVGEMIWSYFNYVKKQEAPYPSIADVFYVLYYPFLAASMWYFLKTFRLFFAPRHVFEVVAVFLIGAALVYAFYYLYLPGVEASVAAEEPAEVGEVAGEAETAAAEEGASFGARFFDLVYAAGDVVLLTIVYSTLRLSGGRIQRGIALFSASLFVVFLADLVFGYRIATGAYWNGDLSNFLYATGALLFPLGLLSAARGIFPESVSSPPDAAQGHS